MDTLPNVTSKLDFDWLMMISNIQKSLYTLVTDWGLYGLQVLILLAFILFLSKLSDREEACEKRLLRKLIANRCRFLRHRLPENDDGH